MTTSPNLLMDLLATGSNPGTWGTITNDNLSIIDNRFGGRQAKSVASSNVTLSDAEAENVFQRITGTLGANIDYIFPASSGGFYLISNEATGSFDITVKPSGGTGVTVPQGAMTLVFINPSQTTALKINVVSTGAANTFTALQTFSAGIAVTGAASPTTNDAAALGSTSLKWSDLFLASGGVINWNSGDVTITHSANTLTFAGASSGYGFADGAVFFAQAAVPATNDVAALGSASLQWSDLFLASGGVVNWGGSAYTITHSPGNLAFSGQVSFGTALQVSSGGTGATTLTGLLQGNGTGAITGGATINNGNWSGTDLAVTNGGTGASDAATAARTLLNGLGTTKGNILWYNGSNWTVLAPP